MIFFLSNWFLKTLKSLASESCLVVCDDCLTEKIQIEFIPWSSSNYGRFESFTSTFFFLHRILHYWKTFDNTCMTSFRFVDSQNWLNQLMDDHHPNYTKFDKKKNTIPNGGTFKKEICFSLTWKNISKLFFCLSFQYCTL
jgi:hypothetical protein